MTSYYPWQHTEWAQLQDRARAQRLAHALLVTGPAGVGKRDFVRAFGASLLCRRPTDSGTACAQCEACLLLAAGTHPDFLAVSCLEDKTQIGIDQIRALSRSLSMKSHAGGYKVAILQPAEAMTVEAANSLLKTLEEPTDNTVLILITEQPARLAATIRSRCQLLRFAAPPLAQGSSWLVTHAAEQDSELLLRLADGAPLRALAMAQDALIARRRDWLEQLQGLRRGQQSPIVVAASWNEDAEGHPLYWFTSFLSDMIRVSQAGVETIKNIDLKDMLNAIADELTGHQLHMLLERATHTQQLAQQSGINRLLLLEELLTEWGRAGHVRRHRASRQ